MARISYTVQLAVQGELSGDLIVVGQTREAYRPGYKRKAVIHSFMSADSLPVEFIGNCRQCISTSFSNIMYKSAYGNSSARLVTPGFFFRKDEYLPRDFFRGADIIEIKGRPLVECLTENPRFENPGEDYRIPCYIEQVFGMYEHDFRKGRLSNRMMWHIKDTQSFLLYRHWTRKVERMRWWDDAMRRWGFGPAPNSVEMESTKRSLENLIQSP